MKRRSNEQVNIPAANPRQAAVKRMLTIAQLIRKQGTPDEAKEALEWETKLSNRLTEIQAEQPAAA